MTSHLSNRKKYKVVIQLQLVVGPGPSRISKNRPDRALTEARSLRSDRAVYVLRSDRASGDRASVRELR
ncbi:hypothetical protein YC2023_040624 [Brassica napus]